MLHGLLQSHAQRIQNYVFHLRLGARVGRLPLSLPHDARPKPFQLIHAEFAGFVRPGQKDGSRFHLVSYAPGGGRNSSPYFLPISITREMSCCCCEFSAPISSKKPSKPDGVMTHMRRPGFWPR